MKLVRRSRPVLFPVNVWPPMADALTLVLAAFVLLMVLGAVAQRDLLVQLLERDREMAKLREDKARIERRLQGLAVSGMLEIEGDKVILQGEVLFDSGSDELHPSGQEFLGKLAPPLVALLQAEPDQMVMIGGHTDDVPIHNARFASNWELSTARAVAVARMLVNSGVSPARVVAAGFGPHHPRADNVDEKGRQLNRRIEVLLVPIRAVSSK
ncbi:MAG: OmpA family protein [Myxococcota bacterium]